MILSPHQLFSFIKFSLYISLSFFLFLSLSEKCQQNLIHSLSLKVLVTDENWIEWNRKNQMKHEECDWLFDSITNSFHSVFESNQCLTDTLKSKVKGKVCFSLPGNNFLWIGNLTMKVWMGFPGKKSGKHTNQITTCHWMNQTFHPFLLSLSLRFSLFLSLFFSLYLTLFFSLSPFPFYLDQPQSDFVEIKPMKKSIMVSSFFSFANRWRRYFSMIFSLRVTLFREWVSFLLLTMKRICNHHFFRLTNLIIN